MSVENETPERLELRKKLQRCQTTYTGLLDQQENTRGAFPGQQLAGGLAPLPSQIARAKQNMDDAGVALNDYDATHPTRNQRE